LRIRLVRRAELPMKSNALLVLFAFAPAMSIGAAAPVAVQQDKSDDVAVAPDGQRGFGLALRQKELGELLKSKDKADKAFFADLTELTTSTRVLLLNVRQLYSDRGYFKFLPGSAGEDLSALHIAYAKICDSPAHDLAVGDARAKALAEMLIDTRFNVRRDLMLRAQVAVDDLEHARAVFGATSTGYVNLIASEMEHICARADLAAAELRALRSDLEALKPTPDEKPVSPEDQELCKKLVDIARNRDEHQRAADMSAALAPMHELESRMQQLLFSARIEPKLAPLREWRARVLATAAEFRGKVLELLPDTPEGDKARTEIAHMKKTDRINQAYGLAVQGLGNDPLDPELAWAAGHARQFSWPGLDGICYFDRFLALSGLRTSDARPGNGRKLTPREQEAFDAVAGFRH
jgi:hypothetical protein